MLRRPQRSTPLYSSAASDVYKRQAIEYMQNGSKASVERLTEQMYEASENLEFEKAAKLRDRINAIEKMKDGQDIFSDKTYDFDVVALAQNVELASIAVMCYRGGRITDKMNFFIGDEYDPGQMRSDFLVEYYSARTDAIPKQIYIAVSYTHLMLPTNREVLFSLFHHYFYKK